MAKKVNAYAVHQINTRIEGKKTLIPASTKERPSVFVTSEEELKKLEALGAARVATEEELAIAKHKENVIDTTVAAKAPVSSVGDAQPASGAKGDPKGGRKPANKSAAEGSEGSEGSGAVEGQGATKDDDI